MSESFVIGKLTFDLRRSEKRRSIGITIERDGSLLLTAPVNCPMNIIERVAKDKQFWIHKKLAEQKLLAKPRQEKEFVSGEGFYYLGRSFRLLLFTPSQNHSHLPPLRLYHGRFILNRNERYRGQEHFINWYIHHAYPWLNRRTEIFSDRLQVKIRALEIRDLGYRWGSCNQDGKINFHWRTILLPPRIIEYIVAHELIHLHEPQHNQNFWQKLERAMPDYLSRKRWLAENGGRF